METVLVTTESPIDYPNIGSLYLVDSLNKSGISTRVMSSGGTLPELERLVDESNASAVNMSVITSPQIENSVDLSIGIKKSRPNVKVIWGGIHPTINEEQCSSEKYIDHVISGPGEDVLPGVLRDIDGGRPVPSIIRAPKIIDIDKYSPAWDSVDNMSQFLFPSSHSMHSSSGRSDKKNIFYYLNTSRGCPYSCSFCAIPTDKNWQSHSVKWVKNQVNDIRDRLKVEGREMDGVGIWDDMFWGNKKRAYSIINQLSKDGLGYMVEARADQLLKNDGELLNKLVSTGCMSVFVGAESGNQKTLDYLDKGTTVDDYHKLIEMSSSYGISTRFSLVVGFPYESDKSVNDTLDLSDKISDENNEYCSVSGPKLFTPYPGTVEFNRAIERGFDLPKNTRDWSEIHRKTNNYTDRFPWIKENLSGSTLKRMEAKLR